MKKSKFKTKIKFKEFFVKKRKMLKKRQLSAFELPECNSLSEPKKRIKSLISSKGEKHQKRKIVYQQNRKSQVMKIEEYDDMEFLARQFKARQKRQKHQSKFLKRMKRRQQDKVNQKRRKEKIFSLTRE